MAQNIIKRAPGRPSDYTPELGEAICARLLDGEGLRSLCRDEEMPSTRTVLRWLDRFEDFRRQYVRARELAMELMAEEIIEIADDRSGDVVYDEAGVQHLNSEFARRSAIRIEARK